MASWTASLRTVPRPTRWSITAVGTLPRRKPGTWTCEPISRYAFLRLGSSSTNGTSMASRTRVGLRVSTVLFTGVLLDGSQLSLGVIQPIECRRAGLTLRHRPGTALGGTRGGPAADDSRGGGI